MQLLRDFYLVLVDQLYESETTKSGIITRNTAPISEEQEDRGAFRRRYGKVLEVPVGFSDGLISVKEPPGPAPRRYINHEWIQYMRNAQHKFGLRPYDEKLYYPSTFEKYDILTCEEIARRVNVEVGDKIYFGENALEDERFMGRYQGKLMYSVRVDEIQAVIKMGVVFDGYGKLKAPKIYMQGQWILVKVDMSNWEDKPFNIPGVEEPVMLKVAKEGKPLKGKIQSSNRRDLKFGDEVFFEQDADAPCVIEGQEYSMMLEEDILAIIKP